MPRRNRKTMLRGYPRRHTRADWRHPSKAMIRRLERWEKYLQKKYVQFAETTEDQGRHKRREE